MNDINKNLDTKEVNKDTSEVADYSLEPTLVINKLKALSILILYTSWAENSSDVNLDSDELFGIHGILNDIIRDFEKINKKYHC